MIFETDKLETGTYALSGTDMLYSAKYGGYTYITIGTETDASLSSKLTVSANPVTEVDYSGDTNNSGKVTGMDTIAFNDALHGVTPSGYVIDIPMRLSLDVDGSKSVTVTDIAWVLDKAVGNHS